MCFVFFHTKNVKNCKISDILTPNKNVFLQFQVAVTNVIKQKISTYYRWIYLFTIQY